MEHDESKFRLWLTHRAALVDYASGMTRNRAEAEDVVQDAYLRFVPETATLRNELSHPLGYLYRIVRNLALDWGRRHRREADGEVPLAAMVSPAADPERQTAGRVELRRVAQALETLSPQARTAFVLHRIDGCTLQQVASRLEVSVPTAHRLVRDALMRLAAGLDDSHG